MQTEGILDSTDSDKPEEQTRSRENTRARYPEINQQIAEQTKPPPTNDTLQGALDDESIAVEDLLTAHKVLVIGKASVTKTLSKALRGEKYIVYQSTTIEEGLTLARWVHPDIMLLDDSITDYELDALDEIQATDVGINTPIIHMPHVKPSSLYAERVDDSLVKPFNRKQLLDKLAEHLGDD